MARTNYSFAKRQKELAKKQKKEEKRQRKADSHEPEAGAELNPAAPMRPDGATAALEPASEVAEAPASD